MANSGAANRGRENYPVASTVGGADSEAQSTTERGAFARSGR